MKTYERKITKEIYDNAVNNHHGVLADEDEDKVFSMAEVCGYGVYCPYVFTRNNEYYVRFEMGDTCD